MSVIHWRWWSWETTSTFNPFSTSLPHSRILFSHRTSLLSPRRVTEDRITFPSPFIGFCNGCSNSWYKLTIIAFPTHARWRSARNFRFKSWKIFHRCACVSCEERKNQRFSLIGSIKEKSCSCFFASRTADKWLTVEISGTRQIIIWEGKGVKK